MNVGGKLTDNGGAVGLATVPRARTPVVRLRHDGRFDLFQGAKKRI